MTIAAVHHVSLSVSDLDRSTRWYEDLFELDRVMTEEAPGRRAVVYRFRGSRLMLGLVEHEATAGGVFDPTVPGLDHVAFDVASREELEAWTERLDARSIPHSGIVEIPPGAICNLRDPDGIALALFWER